MPIRRGCAACRWLRALLFSSRIRVRSRVWKGLIEPILPVDSDPLLAAQTVVKRVDCSEACSRPWSSHTRTHAPDPYGTLIFRRFPPCLDHVCRRAGLPFPAAPLGNSERKPSPLRFSCWDLGEEAFGQQALDSLIQFSFFHVCVSESAGGRKPSLTSRKKHGVRMPRCAAACSPDMRDTSSKFSREEAICLITR